MKNVTLYSASAGTGKTFTICDEIARRVEEGLDARRILACTFTKKAAAELKSRVQGALLEKGKIEAAAALDLAPIGTVHSVGHRFISRFALRLGLSPDLTVLPEGGDVEAFRDILNASGGEAWQELVQLESRLAIKGVDQEGGEPLLLKLLRLKRQNAIPDEVFLAQMAANAKRFVEVLISGASHGNGGFDDAIKEAKTLAADAASALARVSGDGHADALASVRALARDGAGSWVNLARVAELKPGKGAGAEDAVAALRSFAMGLRRHPGLTADCARYMELLGRKALEVEKQYADYKRQRGLLDYTDMEAHFYSLVTDPAFREDLRAELSLVIVDEFQDTNPVQLAIFQALSELAEESIWVGDHKQTIYAFNGAAPDLMTAVWSDPKVQKKTLDTNRRSAKGIVDIANQVFSPVFGEDSTMKPHEPAQVDAAERWLLVGKNKDDEARALAQSLSDFLARSKRPLSDIAILVRQNSWGSQVASALGEAGIPVALAVGGLLSTRECASVLAGLRLAADRYDSLAAATLLQLLEPPTDETPSWLDARLAELTNGKDARLKPFDGHPLLAKLDAMEPRELSPRAAVSAVIEALGLTARVGDWTEPARRAANLDAMLSEADVYEETAMASGRSATLAGLIVHLETQQDSGEDTSEPPRGLDAVQVLTYHRAKGLEWPVVVLTQLDTISKGDVFEPSVTGGNFAAGKPLDGRRINFWPHPFERYNKLGLEDDARQTPEGQKVAADVLEEARRLLYVGFTRPKELLVLATKLAPLKTGDSHKHKWLDALPPFAQVLGGLDRPGKHQHSKVSGAVHVVRCESPEKLTKAKPIKKQNWFPAPALEAVTFVSRYRHPSSEPAAPADFRLDVLPGAPAVANPPVGVDTELMGNAFHAYFSALPSLSGMPAAAHLDAASRILAGFGLTDLVQAAGLVAHGERLKAFIKARYPGARWLTEIPITAPAESGAQWDGAIDLLLELPDSSLVILDHKSFFGKDAHIKEKAAEHTGQLRGYAAALRAAGREVTASGLHLPLAGRICWLEK